MSKMRALNVLAVAASAVLVAGCPQLESKPDAFPVAGGACHLAHDQLGTLMSPVLTLPVKVFIDPEYSKSQNADIRAMAAQWNDFGRASLGVTFFEVVDGDPHEFAKLPHGPEYCDPHVARVPGIAFIRERVSSRWDDEQVSADADGVTRRCTFGDGTAASEQTIVVETEKMPAGALRSIALHELGHALGLNHSCTRDRKRATDFNRLCEGLRASDPYYEAVMFPALEVRGSSVSDPSARLMPKEALRSNDLERAYCLYKNIVKKPEPHAEPAGASGASGADSAD